MTLTKHEHRGLPFPPPNDTDPTDSDAVYRGLKTLRRPTSRRLHITAPRAKICSTKACDALQYDTGSKFSCFLFWAFELARIISLTVYGHCE